MIKRTLLLVLGCLLIAASIAGCTGRAEENQGQDVHKSEVKVFLPDGLPALSGAKLVYESPQIAGDMDVIYTITNTPDVLVSRVLSEEADIAVVPSNLAAQAYNQGLPYRLLATVGWGSFYLISTEDISDWESLRGKEIYNIGRGLTPDIVFKYLLIQNGLEPDKEVKITYLNAATELAPAFISGKSTIAVMPEPMLTNVLSNKDDAKIVLDLNNEWKEVTGSSLGYPQSSLIAREELVNDYPEFLQAFIDQYENSTKWANENPEILVEYADNLQISVTRDAVEGSISRANLNFIEVSQSIEEYNKYYEILLDFEAKVIGGKLPDEGLYVQ